MKALNFNIFTTFTASIYLGVTHLLGWARAIHYIFLKRELLVIYKLKPFTNTYSTLKFVILNFKKDAVSIPNASISANTGFS